MRIPYSSLKIDFLQMNIKTFYLGIAVSISLLQACQTVGNESAEGHQEKVSFCLNDKLKETTKIEVVKELPVEEQLTLPGKIEYNENDLVAFRSLLGGLVEKVNFELGDYVQENQVLATVRSTQIQELQQQQKFQKNQIDLLKQQVASKKELAADGLLAIPELLEAEHNLESAIIELDKIEQGLQLYKSVGSGMFQISAPKNGYIIQKSISKGQSLTEDSDPLFSISNLKQVWVMVNIYASNLRYVHVGDEVKVRTIAYPDQLYNGKIDKIYNVFDDDEHVIKARVVLDNQNLMLMPGLSADILINRRSDLGIARAIPKQSRIYYNNKEYVVVYKSDCELEAREVTILASNEEHYFVQEQFVKDERLLSSNVLLVFEQLMN
ncbi:efflux RND transporter periplasmic adaptor subunit [Sphingobacterium sp. UT-1RO-CII-1]|uniref:efflux RND transporter periplasmic adaptor subunit n=1 Tax=Sphingobacterium sp. UT-1RO-CII-1 TaxID=2995225 RepID=UPI00227D639B|nr:efflux RND transporter periplasmic adaptor subunit [Sphingobacterium sp. UT-1RO-CII-1]MCY4781481.1 efflux RND transporter periplasmic adaptor subunit [Sphingobacterium sp. UT-1RO-CII-1]